MPIMNDMKISDFPRSQVTLLGVPIIRIIAFGNLLGSSYSGKFPYKRLYRIIHDHNLEFSLPSFKHPPTEMAMGLLYDLFGKSGTVWEPILVSDHREEFMRSPSSWHGLQSRTDPKP